MKSILKFVAYVLLTGILFHLSCKKETSCEGCATKSNKPPIAVAGPDQVITLPTDSVSLNGSSSSDPDGKISEWLWTKISGPASFTINSPIAKTVVKNLIAGAYQFELKVTDNGGLFSKDTIQIIVNDSVQINQPPMADTLSGREIIYNGGWSCNDLCRDGDVYWDSSPWNDNFYSDSNIPLTLSIRLDTSSVWIDVHSINSTLPPINQFYWQIDRGYLWVFAYEGRLIGTPVTIKVKFL